VKQGIYGLDFTKILGRVEKYEKFLFFVPEDALSKQERLIVIAGNLRLGP
jgi:hypothetical protein